MNQRQEYLVPDYYPDFHCKMGDCRSACCVGWPISISMRDYFRLLGTPCEPWLRRRIDGALHMVKYPTEEQYAQICPRYDGNCPMRLEDGRCGVHAEMGEEALPYVCRLYPRGVRTEGDNECSCANSCEAVLEQLFAREEPIKFISQELTFNLPHAAGRTVFFETVGREQEIRLWLISFLQDRSRTLAERLVILGLRLQEMENALKEKDEARVDELLRQKGQGETWENAPLCREHLEAALFIAEGMTRKVHRNSQSILEYGKQALNYFASGENAFDLYLAARDHLEQTFPNWENWFEHILVNHLFFTRFPFQDRPVTVRDEYFALCGIYGFLRFLCLGWMAQRKRKEELVDVVAAAFRLFQHTEFDRYCALILKEFHCDQPEKIHNFVRL